MKVMEIVDPIVDFTHFSPINRKNGISGFMRLRNEAEFLALVIESWLPLLDELIIVYNNCQDNTGEIALDYMNKFPDKIKCYHYIPIVYPQGSSNYKTLLSNDFHSLVNYYNFALSKTTYKWALKIDGDLILPWEKINEIKTYYYDMTLNHQNFYLAISGVNIIDDKKAIYVPSSSKFCGLNGDLCLFRVDHDTIFKKASETEILDLSNRVKLKNIFGYYHMKFIKSDYGVGNYDFINNPDSNYYAKTLVFLLFLRLIPLSKVLKDNNIDMPLFREDMISLRGDDYKKGARKFLKQYNIRLSLRSFFREIYIHLKIISYG
ncbi:hypothetical protein A1D23_10365 [Chelonobacter oris]|uniref:hypothetical protein n=1 Tax=Chelonobacter oris TaxID=505317 RepID=UPI002447E9E8|nr:hypothetical protein [Chelonobacter oris]MDH3000859.1 hypothetical protein [Chelonobacter oris]